jgi:hypothetical protein
VLIAMPVNDRPGTLARVLHSWSRARPPREGLQFIFAVEPDGDPQLMADIIKRYSVTHDWPSEIHFNQRQLGVDGNPPHVIDLAFEHADRMVYSEDDVVVSEDVAEYLSWGLDRYERDGSVLAVCAFELNGQHDPAAVRRDREFRPTCFAMHRNRWEDGIRSWDFEPRPDFGWDNYIQQRHLMTTGRCVIKPVQSRSQHVGWSGTKAGTEGHGFIQSSSFLPCVAAVKYKEI